MGFTRKIALGLLVPIVFWFPPQKVFANDEASFLGRVLMHKNVANVEAQIAEDGFSYLQKVEKKQTYRCPGCFRYEVTFVKFTEDEVLEKKVQLFTSLNNTFSEINVKVIDE